MERMLNLKPMKRFTLVFVTLLLVAACQKQSEQKSGILMEAAPEAGGFSSVRLAKLDSAMNDWVKKKWLNGAVALIARKGKIVFYKSAGYNDMETIFPFRAMRATAPLSHFFFTQSFMVESSFVRRAEENPPASGAASISIPDFCSDCFWQAATNSWVTKTSVKRFMGLRFSIRS